MPKEISDTEITVNFSRDDYRRLDLVCGQEGWDRGEAVRELAHEGLLILDGEARLLSDQLGLGFGQVKQTLMDLKAEAAMGEDTARQKTESDYVRAAVVEALDIRDLKAGETSSKGQAPAADRGRVLQLVSPPKRDQ